MLVYGHGDVQFGHADDWSEGRSPWHLSIEGDALYGRGSADNKGQHTVDLCALGAVIGVRGKLGYNVTVLIEMGEEAGSVGLSEIVREHAGDLHSGNWGGRVRNPATVLAAAIGAFVDGDGVIRADFLRPSRIPDPVRRAVQALPEPADDGGPAVDRDWGEPGLSPNERVFAWNTVEVLALEAGDPAEPKNAIPARARAVLQLRYVVGTDVSDFAAKAERVLRERGIRGVTVRAHEPVPATRLDPAAPVVRAAEVSIAETVGREPAVEPNLGGTIPNAVFADQLGLPTVWIPHSPPGPTSTPRMSTRWPPCCARACGSWRGCSGTWASDLSSGSAPARTGPGSAARVGLMELIIRPGDITRTQADAIVNAANHTLYGGGGVDGAIHRAGGPEILAACRRLRAERFPDGLPTGQAAATTAGELPACWVIHTVGPTYAKTKYEQKAPLLASCYRESLRVAAELGAASVAFPAISAGIYGWPMDDAARIAVETVRATAEEVGETVRTVLFTPYGSAAETAFRAAFG